MKTSQYLTEALFPKNGVWMTEQSNGYFVAKYDAKSMTEGNRWFPTMEKANGYAETLARR